MNYEVTCKNYETDRTYVIHRTEDYMDAYQFVENEIDEDLTIGDYEKYDYFINGELIN